MAPRLLFMATAVFASYSQYPGGLTRLGRRGVLALGGGGLGYLLRSGGARGDPRQGGDREGLTARGPNNVFAGGRSVLCDDTCLGSLDDLRLVTTPSGLSFRDIEVGSGPKPPKGYQITINAVMSVKDEEGNLQPFVNSLARGFPIEFRVGTGSTIKGIDEGVSSMRLGGIRRLYIPGPLSYTNGVRTTGAGPQVPPGSPIVVDIQLAYISGLDMEDEDVE
ncbi:hypothetical protein AAMO2058_001215900 [Amorphochlora amoebiformis]